MLTTKTDQLTLRCRNKECEVAQCPLLGSKFDPALFVAELEGREFVSARRFVRFASTKGLVHDELEAERLATALGLRRHESGRRSVLEVAAVSDLLFAIQSIQFSNGMFFVMFFVAIVVFSKST